MEKWNRKDKEPKDTVQFIKKILQENGIETKITSETEYRELWCSNRIEFEGLNGRGTNGKGITREFAMASGYAEFMERLQTRMLFEGLFPNKENQMKDLQVEDEEFLCKLYMYWFKKYLERNDLFSVKKVKELIQAKKGQYSILKKYYDFSEKKIVYLPERFIFSICGSNGLCSGNTKHEAFCQGLCEVFERYVNYKIYFDNNLKFPTIEKKNYEKLNSYAMIKALEERGYEVYVKDCTLNGMLPVLGVLVTNRSKTKYYFKLGSDINMDICLQRCITEMFQGLDINTTFRLQLKDVDDCEYDEFWRLRNTKEEHYKNIRTGDGKLPRTLFLNIKSNNLEIKPFINEKIGNKEAVKYLMNIATNCGMHILIKDYSYLGFNTLSIYVPGFSEIIDYDYGLAELQDVFERIRQLILQDDIDILNLNKLLIRIVSEHLVSADYTISELLGLNLKKEYQGILKSNIYFFIAWLNVLLKQPDECIKWLKQYHYLTKINKRDARIETIIFQALMNDISKTTLLSFLKNITTEKEEIGKRVDYYYQLREKGIKLNICRECEECDLHTYCNYDFLCKFKDNLNRKYYRYEQEYDYTDDFYKCEG